MLGVVFFFFFARVLRVSWLLLESLKSWQVLLLPLDPSQDLTVVFSSLSHVREDCRLQVWAHVAVSKNQQAPGVLRLLVPPSYMFLTCLRYSSHHIPNSKQETGEGDRTVFQDALYSGLCLYFRASPAPRRVRNRDHLVEHSFAPPLVLCRAFQRGRM